MFRRELQWLLHHRRLLFDGHLERIVRSPWRHVHDVRTGLRLRAAAVRAAMRREHLLRLL